MIKQLSSFAGRETIEAIYEKIGLKEDIRAERVTVDQFRQITDCLLR